MVAGLMSPQMQIFSEVFKISEGLGFSTYDYLPAKETKLPFVFVGEQFDVDKANKTSVTGEVSQTIHIYGIYTERRNVTSIMDDLKTEIRKLRRTSNFMVNVRGINSQTIIDDSTAQTLLHGIVEIDFKFN